MKQPYIYYLSPTDNHECFEVGNLFLVTKPIKDNMFPRWLDSHPDEFFDNDGNMDFFNVIGNSRLLKIWINGKLYMTPCAVYLHSQYRGQGYGKLLYKSLLKGVEQYRAQIKTLPFFANHTIADDVNKTSKMAKQVYSSLERENILSFVKDSITFTKKYDWRADIVKTREGDIYKIKKFPSDLKMEHIDTLNLEGYCYYNHACPTYNLYEIRQVGGAVVKCP